MKPVKPRIHFGALTIILESVNYMHLILYAYIQVVSWCVFIRIQHLACLCHQWLVRNFNIIWFLSAIYPMCIQLLEPNVFLHLNINSDKSFYLSRKTSSNTAFELLMTIVGIENQLDEVMEVIIVSLNRFKATHLGFH